MDYNMRDMLYHLKSNDFVKYNGQEKHDESVRYLNENLYNAIKDNVEFFAFHPKLYKNQDVFFQVSISCFSNLNLNLDDLIEIQDRFNSSAVGLYGKSYDNSAYIMLSDGYGRLFKSYISKSGSGYTLNLYDTTGGINLATINTKTKELSKDEIKILESAWDLLMDRMEKQRKSRERYAEIQQCREYIKVEHQKSSYASAYYKVTVNKNIPIEISEYEIAKYCDGWNYCFGGKCSMVTKNEESKIYNVVVYTD
ncbi:hypothetical protein [Brevibacillus porteri]|uniref:hypothetical protein n=1 Tax=Brevibacillus porteri TaxID=2126350 RepID=UPI003632CC24